MDDTVRQNDVPLISEQNWLNYFQSLHSNKPLNSIQMITNELKHLEIRKTNYYRRRITCSREQIREQKISFFGQNQK